MLWSSGVVPLPVPKRQLLRSSIWFTTVLPSLSVVVFASLWNAFLPQRQKLQLTLPLSIWKLSLFTLSTHLHLLDFIFNYWIIALEEPVHRTFRRSRIEIWWNPYQSKPFAPSSAPVRRAARPAPPDGQTSKHAWACDEAPYKARHRDYNKDDNKGYAATLIWVLFLLWGIEYAVLYYLGCYKGCCTKSVVLCGLRVTIGVLGFRV